MKRFLAMISTRWIGGWGQITKGAFSGKNDPAWQEMLELVKGSVTALEFHDIAGTCGRRGGCEVLTLRHQWSMRTRKHLSANQETLRCGRSNFST